MNILVHESPKFTPFAIKIQVYKLTCGICNQRTTSNPNSQTSLNPPPLQSRTTTNPPPPFFPSNSSAPLNTLISNPSSSEMCSNQEDHYAALGVDPSATPEDIKSAFHQAALRLHPDKNKDSSNADFFIVQRAWDVLGDPELRATYDQHRAVAASHAAVHIADHIALDDMDRQSLVVDSEPSSIVSYSWPCRCGGAYLILEADLILSSSRRRSSCDEMVVACSTCSLHIAVV